HSGQEQAVYRFAECELDPREHRLLVRGQQVTLTPKVFETLVLLVERAGHVVSKDELMAALWPRGFVHESNLTKHIWLIRRALGDGEDEGRYIETVPKLGYRFIAPVQTGFAQEAGNDTVSPAETAAGTTTESSPPGAEVAASASNEESRSAATKGAVAPSSRRFAWLAATVALVLIAALAG